MVRSPVGPHSQRCPPLAYQLPFRTRSGVRAVFGIATRPKNEIAVLTVIFLIVLFAASSCRAAEIPKQKSPTVPVAGSSRSRYIWESQSIDGTAQLMTLFCHLCSGGKTNEDVPLISVLKDTLGDNDPENDRVSDVWLLSCTHFNLGQRLLSAVPFFYWRVGPGSRAVKDTAPLLDLTTPQSSIVSAAGQDFLHWTLLDSITTPVRAASRAYRGNATDYERLQLEEVIGYLRQAPVPTDSPALTQDELDIVIARLELRKHLLGGLVPERLVGRVGATSGFDQERVRSRNWEILRQSAERTGLLFEPLTLADTAEEYGMLWFPLGATPPASGVSLGAVWKLLNLKDPWRDKRLRAWGRQTYTRTIDENGSFVLPGTPRARSLQLVPLAVYGFDYPKLPLLLIDFRYQLRVRRRETMQRATDELTGSIIGISHFTNWYYFVGKSLHGFLAGRHGAALNRAARLDSYAHFRTALTLDHSLDADLRTAMQRRMDSLNDNPLEARTDLEIQMARSRYNVLQADAKADGRLATRIDKQRRAELAPFGESGKAQQMHLLLHDLTFGLYTHRAQKDEGNLLALDRNRRIQSCLKFLDSIVQAGTRPEIAYDSTRIEACITELSGLMHTVQVPRLRTLVAVTLTQIRKISKDPQLQATCSAAIAALESTTEPGSAPSTPISAMEPVQ